MDFEDSESVMELLSFPEDQQMVDLQQDMPDATQEPIGSEELLRRFGEFVQAATQEAMEEAQRQPKFWSLVSSLCKKAPQAAELLGTRILKDVGSGGHREDAIEEPDANAPAAGRTTKQRRKHGVEDSSYRPPKHANATNLTLKTGVNRQSTRLAGGKFSKGGNSVDSNIPQNHAKATSPNTKGAKCDESKATNLTARSDPVDDSPLIPAKVTSSLQAECEDSKVTSSAIPSGAERLERANRAGLEAHDSGTVVRHLAFANMPSPNRKAPVPTDSKEQNESPEVAKPGGPVQSTPAHQTNASPIESPRTEEIYRENIPTSVESIRSSPGLMSDAPENMWTVTDHILEAVRIIYGLSKHQDGLPRQVHVTILQALRDSCQDVLVSSEWSSGSMWAHILEAGSVEGQKVTILRMLEYMGAWEWYDSQVRLRQESGTICTKKNKPVSRKGAATHVLNEIQRSGKCIKSLGRLTLENEGSIGASSDGPDTIIERNRKQQRQRIVTQLSRGQKLSTKLVKELGLGILFSPKIWEYTKKDAEQLEHLIRYVRADPEHMTLLQILSKQLEMFIIEGQPDIHSLLESLLAEGLISESDHKEIASQFPSRIDSTPSMALNAAVDRLKNNISIKVLGKPELGRDDIVTVRGGIEFNCGMFDRLRYGEWFDAWLLLASAKISDKPSFVRYGYSVPLDERFGKRNVIKRIARPLAGWRKKVESWSKANKAHGTTGPLVYFCPLNHSCSHFTLLEINERDEAIYHYDSKAGQGVIDGTQKSTRVHELVQEEFGYLQFKYVEVPTPQQEGNADCGPMVGRNEGLRMNGFSVGKWEDKLDPVRLRMDMVEAFEICVSDNALWPKGGPAEPGQLSTFPEEAPRELSAKRSTPPEASGSDTPSKRRKRT